MEIQRRRMALSLGLAFIFFFFCGLCCCGASANSSRQKLEVKNHLKHLNKHALKTIKSPDGDIIDCVHISHQPAFYHPFLKDHKIQMRPSYHPGGGGMYDEDKMGKVESEVRSGKVTQLWHKNGRCLEDEERGCPEGKLHEEVW